MDRDQPIDTLRARLRSQFETLRQGGEVTPASRYRAEGFAQALVATGTLDQPAVTKLIADTWREVFGCSPPPLPAGDIHIPCVMKRAPVYPSTGNQ